MKISVKLTAAILALGLMSGCATTTNNSKTTNNVLCGLAGAIVGGAISTAADATERDEMAAAAAVGAAVAVYLCPLEAAPQAPVCTDVAPEGALLDANGCAFDSDNDGVVDGIDQCADSPAGSQVNALGCPLDSDGDGVVDHLDECPNTVAGMTVDSKGCALVAGDTILSLNGVNFETNSAVLTAHAKGQLDNAINLLADATNVVNVRVEGHTDSRGAAAYNQTLSLQRAESVIHYLVNHGGVDVSKLIAVGMGEGSPAASNASAEGRAMNRRVDFVVSQ
jgi:OOP family OmpA-OmpF porin